MGFNPFSGWQPGSTPSIYDVARRQKLAEALSGQSYVSNSGALGALAQALAGSVGGFENKYAADESQAGLDASTAGLGKALSGGYGAISADPSSYVQALSNPFLPQAAAQGAGAWATDQAQAARQASQNQFSAQQQQAELNKPQYFSGGYNSGPVIFNPGAPEGKQITPVDGGGAGSQTIDSIVSGIEGGTLPPSLTGLSRPLAAAVQARLANDGFDMTKAQIDFGGDKHGAISANGAPQLRLRQVEETADNSLGLIKDISDKWQALGKGNSQFPLLNKANFAAALQGVYGQDAQSLATQLKAQMSDVVSELATIYRGGNAPTQEAFEQAQTQLDTAWSQGTLEDMISNIRKNIEIRKAATTQSTVQVPTTAAPSSSADDPLGIL